VTSETSDRTRFRRTLVRVLSMQTATLIALWLLQITFTR
jgi:hypothetical protein